MKLPRCVEFILDRLNKSGFEAYVVGGCVRDFLMGVEPADYDIATSANPAEIKALFQKTFDTGIKHGTVTVIALGGSIEVTTFRIDGEYRDSRHPEKVVFTDDLKQDLLRRDFTMNAIAYSPREGHVDICGGRDDIANGIIRGVGNPDSRFREDALRMLRAIRFAGQLGFDIEPETYQAIQNNASLICNISAERIREEFVKLLISGSPGKIRLITLSGLMGYIDSELCEYCERNFTRILPALTLSERKIGIRLAVFLQYMDQKQIHRLMTKLKFDNKRIKEVMVSAKWANIDIQGDSACIREVLSVVGVDAFEDILNIKILNAGAVGKDIAPLIDIKSRFRQIINDKDCISMAQLNINGDDLFEIGFTKGKALGDALNRLFMMVIKNPRMNDESLLKREAERIFVETVRE